MKLLEIVKKIESMNIDITERRNIDDEYCELVFPASDKKEWMDIFTGIFGQPKKPAGVEPTEEIDQLTSDYGVARVNQTLFIMKTPEDVLLAMFMPWNDDDYVTLKLAVLRK